MLLNDDILDTILNINPYISLNLKSDKEIDIDLKNSLIRTIISKNITVSVEEVIGFRNIEFMKHFLKQATIDDICRGLCFLDFIIKDNNDQIFFDLKQLIKSSNLYDRIKPDMLKLYYPYSPSYLYMIYTDIEFNMSSSIVSDINFKMIDDNLKRIKYEHCSLYQFIEETIRSKRFLYTRYIIDKIRDPTYGLHFSIRDICSRNRIRI